MGYASSAEAPSATPLCSHVQGFFPQPAAFYLRLSTMRVKPALSSRAHEVLCPIPFADVARHMYFNRLSNLRFGEMYDSDGMQLRAEFYYNGTGRGSMEFETNLITASGSVQCRFTYTVPSLLARPDDLAPTIPPYSTAATSADTTSVYTTLMGTTAAVTENEARKPTAIIAAVAVVVVALAAVAIVLRWQRQRTSSLLDAFAHAQPKIPPSALTVVSLGGLGYGHMP